MFYFVWPSSSDLHPGRPPPNPHPPTNLRPVLSKAPSPPLLIQSNPTHHLPFFHPLPFKSRSKPPTYPSLLMAKKVRVYTARTRQFSFRYGSSWRVVNGGVLFEGGCCEENFSGCSGRGECNCERERGRVSERKKIAYGSDRFLRRFCFALVKRVCFVLRIYPFLGTTTTTTTSSTSRDGARFY